MSAVSANEDSDAGPIVRGAPNAVVPLPGRMTKEAAPVASIADFAITSRLPSPLKSVAPTTLPLNELTTGLSKVPSPRPIATWTIPPVWTPLTKRVSDDEIKSVMPSRLMSVGQTCPSNRTSRMTRTAGAGVAWATTVSCDGGARMIVPAIAMRADQPRARLDPKTGVPEKGQTGSKATSRTCGSSRVGDTLRP